MSLSTTQTADILDTTSETSEIGKRFVLWETGRGQVATGTLYPDSIITLWHLHSISVWYSQDDMMDAHETTALYWVD